MEDLDQGLAKRFGLKETKGAVVTRVAPGTPAAEAGLRPGGLVLVGLKAVEVRRATKDPYMPLLKRMHEGRPLWFVRFVDFDAQDPAFANFHMVVVGDTTIHRSTRVRVWSPETLKAAFERAGFRDVSVSARIGEPGVAPTTEDVFVHARA